MTIDYTRDTFRHGRRYSAVRLQQGRVSIDADWNEAVDINLNLARTTTGDVVGLTGMPEAAPGFEITPAADSPRFDLLIGEGRAYVGGILVEHGGAPTTLTATSGAGAATIWKVTAGPRLALGQWVGPASDPKSNPMSVATIEAPSSDGLQQVKLTKPLGTGTQTVRAFASMRVQPHWPLPDVPETTNPVLAYLDVWERDITALDDPDIADVALGGVDTAARTKVQWQVRLIAAGTAANPPICKSFPPGWSPDGTTARIQLRARARAEIAQPNPCELPAQGGYRSLENHLYRVEVHTTAGQGPGSALRIKWSRDNAARRSRLLDVAAGSLVVEDIGKDDATAFATDDWLEVLDESRIANALPGFFVQLGEIVGTRLGIRTILDPITLLPLVQNSAPNAAVLPTQGIVRRWEGGAPVPVAANPIPLERGIEIDIQAGLAHTGDYWLIPARSLTASIEWPSDAATGAGAFLPSRGIKHAYCALALLTKANPGGWTLIDDCRPIFSPLTRLETFHYLGGDGQEARPPSATGFTMLEQPLRVGVSRGRTPLDGRPVRFRVTDTTDAGRLSLVAGTNPADVIQSTPLMIALRTRDGVAAVRFELNNNRYENHVTAELLDSSNLAQAAVLHMPIMFKGNTSVASEVAYRPDQCAYQANATITPGVAITVQQAIDKLCPRFEFVPLGGDSQLLCANQPAPAPIAVGVFWGKQPISNVRVNFVVSSGSATVSPFAMTDATGIARTAITAGSVTGLQNGIVRIRATVDTPPVPATPASLDFVARFADADCVYADPKSGSEGVAQEFINAANSNTVAGLLDYLWKREQTEPGIKVLSVFRATNPTDLQFGTRLQQNTLVLPEILAKGLRFDLDGIVPKIALDQPQVGAIELDLPFPVTTDERNAWWGSEMNIKEALVGWTTISLFGTFAPVPTPLPSPAKGAILWTPFGRTLAWLSAAPSAAVLPSPLETAFGKLGSGMQFMLPARAVLRGNRIWSDDSPARFLDGDLFSEPGAAAPILARSPSGNGYRGGDFVFPFFVGKVAVVTGGGVLGGIDVRDLTGIAVNRILTPG